MIKRLYGVEDVLEDIANEARWGLRKLREMGTTAAAPQHHCGWCERMSKYVDDAKIEAQKRGRIMGQPLAEWIASLPLDVVADYRVSAPNAHKANRCPKCGKKDVGEDAMDERCGDNLCWCVEDDEGSPTPGPAGDRDDFQVRHVEAARSSGPAPMDVSVARVFLRSLGWKDGEPNFDNAARALVAFTKTRASVQKGGDHG